MAGGSFGGGSGTEFSPLLVEDAYDLSAVRNSPSLYFEQTADIDMTGFPNWTSIPSVDGFFSGTYDGKGFSITNMRATTENFSGLFGVISQGAVVKNIIFRDAVVDLKNAYAGLLAGQCMGSVQRVRAYDCDLSTSLAMATVGGLIGHLSGEAKQLVNHSPVTAPLFSNVGGLVGQLSATGRLIHSSNHGVVSGASVTGGLVGSSETGAQIVDCYNAGMVSGDFTVGGIVADGGEVVRCYNSGNVEAQGMASGIGRVDTDKVRDSYALNALMIRKAGSTSEDFYMVAPGIDSTHPVWALDVMKIVDGGDV